MLIFTCFLDLFGLIFTSLLVASQHLNMSRQYIFFVPSLCWSNPKLFNFPSQEGKGNNLVTFSLAKKHVLLHFYPKNSSKFPVVPTIFPARCLRARRRPAAATIPQAAKAAPGDQTIRCCCKNNYPEIKKIWWLRRNYFIIQVLTMMQEGNINLSNHQ